MRNFRGKPLIGMLFTALGMNAQTPSVPNQISADAAPRFDVLSVKLTVPGADPLEHRQIRNTEPGRVHYVNVSLKDIVMDAYSLKDYQVIAPDWLNMIAVDIDATMRPGATKEQLRVMFQNLLADRFKLTFHWGAKELPAYSILVARGGPKMRESADLPLSGDSVPPPHVEGPPNLDTDGFPISAARDGIQTITINGRSQLRGRRATIQDLASELSKRQLAVPVTDDTGLNARYDFTLKFATPGWNGRLEDIPELGILASAYAGMEPLPELAEALQSQLGLKLELKRASVEMFVVDHLERTPTAN